MNKLTVVWVALITCLAGYSEAKGPTVYIDETFDSYDQGTLFARTPLHRVEQVSIEKAPSNFGKGKVARYNDSSPTEGGALEYSVGNQGPGRMYIEFDLLNNQPGELESKMALIFSVAKWDTSKTLSLNANSKRAFGLEISQDGFHKTLVLRVGSTVEDYSSYDLKAPQQIKIWVNDHDTDTFSYRRPDTRERIAIYPDSFVVWVNDELIGYDPAGLPMQKSVSAGDNALGRVGFGSPSHGLVDFLIDNFHVEDPTGESTAAPATGRKVSAVDEVSPERMAVADSLQYRTGTNAMNLFVCRPEGCAADKRSARVLGAAVTDTSPRFGKDAEVLSPYHQLDATMPPMLMIHACDDELVNYSKAVALYNKMKSSGNECELISVPQGGHGFSSAFPEWKIKVRDILKEFMDDQKFLPAI